MFRADISSKRTGHFLEFLGNKLGNLSNHRDRIPQIITAPHGRGPLIDSWYLS
jgi:hypothetical protein